MRKVTLGLLGMLAFFCLALSLSPAHAHADTFNYPCTYPFVGTGADVSVIVDAGGQYCDGPTEINWSHYHCESGGATANVGGLAIVGSGPLSLGGFGGNGIGGHILDCHYRCPDGSVAPFPNPPAAWVKRLVLNPKDNDCDQHMGIRGDTSTPLVNQLPGNMAPGEGAPPGVAVPDAPGALPPGVTNPPALPGPPAPADASPGGLPAGSEPGGSPASAGIPIPGKPGQANPGVPDEGSPLTPGSPLQVP